MLSRFGRRGKQAVKGYREFVLAGWSQGWRDDLVGGGLLRSAGGQAALAARRAEERESADERILGGGAFVEEVWRAEERTAPTPRTWQAVLVEVAAAHGIEAARICGGGKERAIRDTGPGGSSSFAVRRRQAHRYRTWPAHAGSTPRRWGGRSSCARAEREALKQEPARP